MSSEITSPGLIACYRCRSSNLIWLMAGLPLAAMIAYRLINSTDEERLVTLALLAFLLSGIGLVAIFAWLFNVRAIEVPASGTIDLVSRARRESFPRSTLIRVEGWTNAKGRWQAGGHYRRHAYFVQFVFAHPDQTEITKQIHLSRRDDPEFQAFVRQLEHLNPKLDTSRFWAWALTDLEGSIA